MKNNNVFFLYMLLSVLLITACSKTVPPYEELTDSKEGAQVFIAKAHSGIQNLSIFPFTDEDRAMEFNIGFGAVGLPAGSIAVKLREDDHAFDSLNTVRLSDGLEPYERFPLDAYDLDHLNLTIPKGGLSSNFATLTYKSKQFDANKQYLLALTIDDASGYTISPYAKTLLFVAKVEESAANTFGWVAQASSEQPGQNTGLPSAVLDGDLNTIWHSKYSPAPRVPYPHWLSFDMLKETYVTKVAIATRQNNLRGMTKFKLEGSRDGESWFALTGDLDFDPADIGYQTYTIEPQYLTNIKITLLQGKQPEVTFLSEFVVYSY